MFSIASFVFFVVIEHSGVAKLAVFTEYRRVNEMNLAFLFDMARRNYMNVYFRAYIESHVYV